MLSTKTILFVWAFFDLCLLSAGVITLIFSIIWRQPNLLLNLTFSSIDLNGATALAALFLATFVSSLLFIGIRNKTSLVIYNWVLLVNGVAILFLGTYIWFFTLHIQDNYHSIFGMQSDAIKIQIQDTLHCCGYFSATDEVAFGGNFCPNATAAMAANSFCVTPITGFANVTLNDVFSTIYGYMAIVIGMFLANMCVILRRQEQERFEKIDAKRGGGGFV